MRQLVANRLVGLNAAITLLICVAVVAPVHALDEQEKGSPVDKPSDRWFSVAAEIVHEDAFAGAHDVELSGELAFVPGKKGAIAIVDVADPQNPELIWFRRDPKELSDSETVLPLGNHLLLGTCDPIHDIRFCSAAKRLMRNRKDPTMPTILCIEMATCTSVAKRRTAS